MAEHQLQKVRPVHERLVDLVIASPRATYAELAVALGYRSEVSIGIIMRSDVFKEKLAQRRSEVIDPVLTAKFEERLEVLADIALDKLTARAEMGVLKDADALKAVELSARARGFGARNAAPLTFVAVMPQKAADPQSWAARYGGGVIDATEISAPPAPPAPEADNAGE